MLLLSMRSMLGLYFHYQMKGKERVSIFTKIVVFGLLVLSLIMMYFRFLAFLFFPFAIFGFSSLSAPW